MALGSWPSILRAMPVTSLTRAEARFLDIRDAFDAADLAEARGLAAARPRQQAAATLAELEYALEHVAADELGDEDVRALTAMQQWVSEALRTQGRQQAADGAPKGSDPTDDLERISRRIMDRYSAAQSAVDVGGSSLTRLAVLGELAMEPSSVRRRELFIALQPVWHSIDGDADSTSPYKRLLLSSADRWARGRSPVSANASALGFDPVAIEPLLVEILDTWQTSARPAEPIEPWDWWYAAGTAERVLAHAIPVERLRSLSDAYHASLGAAPAQLGIRFDTNPRSGRPPVPVAYTTFGRRPREMAGGRWRRAEPWVIGTYTGGGLGELTELVHETGHALHLAAIRTRPAFADWPDSDAFTEALAELTALDTAEPAWQQQWLGVSAPDAVSLRGRYAEVVLDICWALFEIRLHGDPNRRPNDVWTDLTSTYLGIAPHPEWSWWAMRGQLVQEPGYMVNYAIGPILAADLRATVRAERGDWVRGDAGWYEWVSERIYRWGLERSSGDVLRDVLGRRPDPNALLTELARVESAADGSAL
jgi:hypothetical protein